MNWCVELPPASRAQRLLSGLLRGVTRVLFRGLMRPAVPLLMQRALLRLATLLPPRARGVAIRPGRLGEVPCEWLQGARDNGWVVLYLHGGAFVLGSPRTHRAITSHLASLSGARVCAVDYRLAPEHPWPAAVDDALSAYRALLAQGQPADQLVIAGDSAGGQLTLSLALRLREAGLPLPAALVCFSPVSDLSGATWHEPPAGDPLLGRAWLEQGVRSYCAGQPDLRAAWLSPRYASLHDLPPLLVQVGSDEHLLTQSLALQEHAELALRLEVYPGQWHVFQINCGLLQVARLAMQRVAAFLKEQGCQ